MEWLTQFIFVHTRATRPDGRPLYAYRCKDNSYNELQDLVANKLKAIHRNNLTLPAYFCLYAAETFCRNHEGGVWSWETVFSPLGIDDLDPAIRQDLIERGLEWWGRSLIVQNNHRRFLTTIACEGGLPLRLLQNDNAPINHFFRAILENYYQHGCAGVDAAVQISRLQAFHLPITLRQEVVYQLGGELIASIANLQRELSRSNLKNTIQNLNENIPNWRLRLPLRLENEATEALINGLVTRSHELSRIGNSRLRWIGKLKNNANGWQVQKSLECPEIFTQQQILQLLDLGDLPLPQRLRLILKTSRSTEVIALLTLTQGSDNLPVYQREWVRRGGVTLSGLSVTEAHKLFLQFRETEKYLSTENEQPWGNDVPWLFVKKNNNKNPRFWGEGSSRTSEENAFVFVPEELSIESENGEYEKIAADPELKRNLYRISGTVDFLTPENDRYRITCQTQDNERTNYAIVGHTFNNVLNSYPLYLGMPRITNNATIFPAHIIMQRKSVGYGNHWNNHPGANTNSFGQLWLRLFDTTQAIEIFRRLVVVLPSSFQVKTAIGQGLTPGRYILNGLAGATVSGDNNTQIHVTSNGTELNYPVLNAINLPEVNINLRWNDYAQVTICLPYPQRGAVFQLAGQLLSRDEMVSLDRLGGIRLLLQDHAGGQRFWFDGELITTDPLDKNLPTLKIRDHLPPLDNGRLDTSLLKWYDRIASLLSCSHSIDAFVKLQVSTSQGEILARINIARFDCFFVPDFDAQQVRLSPETYEKLRISGLENIRLEMLPLWKPNEQPISLQINTERTDSWHLPDQLKTGPWWIIGREGNWARFRPLLWSVSDNEVVVPESRLEAAIREPDARLREEKLNETLLDLGQNPDDSDWALMLDLIRFSREFPANSLDVLRRLVSYPETLALALIKSNDELFDCVWRLAEQLPFSWNLLSVQCWCKSILLHTQSLQKVLGEMDPHGNIVFEIFEKFRVRTCTKREYWSAICDYLQEIIFLNRPLQNSLLNVARADLNILNNLILEQEPSLQARHDADEEWPQSQELLNMTHLLDNQWQYQHLQPITRSVRCAPFLCVLITINDAHRQLVSENLIYELRLIRAFDSDWFDRVYALYLTIGLSQLKHKHLIHD